jgi:hypothetical protein
MRVPAMSPSDAKSCPPSIPTPYRLQPVPAPNSAPAGNHSCCHVIRLWQARLPHPKVSVAASAPVRRGLGGGRRGLQGWEGGPRCRCGACSAAQGSSWGIADFVCPLTSPDGGRQKATLPLGHPPHAQTQTPPSPLRPGARTKDVRESSSEGRAGVHFSISLHTGPVLDPPTFNLDNGRQ